jgi:hypothetical protein
VSNAKGIRNLSEAPIHSQYRTCALFTRNASVSSAAAPAKIVDCQRWEARASVISDSGSGGEFAL